MATLDDFADTLASRMGELADDEKKRAEKMERLFTDMRDLLKNIDRQFKEELENAKKQVDSAKKNMGGSGGRGGDGGKGGGSGSGSNPHDAGKKAGADFSKGFREGITVKGLAAYLKAVTSEFISWQDLFGGVVLKEMEFMREMRGIAYVTDGITSSAKNMQEQFQQTGKVVAETGMRLDKFQELYRTVLKQGNKAGKESINIAKTGMNLATMIGTSDQEIASLGESITDTFGRWNRQLGMSSNQLSQVSRLIQDTARSTGLTGVALEKVVQNSEQFLKNLRNTKQLTAATAGNVIELTAQAQKLGVGDQMNQVLDAATDSYKLYFEASQQTQTLLFQAANAVGRTAELRTGQLAKSKAGLKDLATGFEQIVQKFGYTMDQIDKLDPEELSRLNMQFKNAYGMEIGEVQRMHDAIKNSAKSMSEQMADINNQLSTQNLKVEERKKLEGDLLKLQTNAGFKFLNAIDEAGKSANNLSDAVSVASQKLGDDMTGDLKTLGVSMSDPIKQVEEAAKITAKKLVEMGGQDMTPQIEKALSSGDMGQIRDLLGEMNAEYRKIGVDQKTALDPISKVAQGVAEINETLRNVIAPWGRYFAGLSVAMLAGVATLTMIYTGFVNLQSVLSLLGGFFGGGTGGGFGSVIGNIMGKPKAGGGGGDKTTEATNALKTETGTSTMPGAGKTQKLSSAIPNFDMKDIASTGAKMAQWAVAMGALAVGLVALMTVVLTLSKGIMSVAGLTPQQVMLTTGAIVALVAGAAAIVGAVALANKGLKEYEANKKELTVSWKTYKEVGKSLLFMLPAILGLAAAVMLFGKSIISMTGMNMSESATLVADIGALILGAAAVVGGIVAVGEALNKVVEKKEIFETIKKNMWTAGRILLTVGGPILAMAVGLGWLASKLLGALGIDSGTMSKLSGDIAALMMGVGSIALALVSSAAGLYVLGRNANVLMGLKKEMATGALIFMILGPAIVGLAAGFAKLVSGVMNLLGMNAGEAARIAGDVASLMWSTAKIALAITPIAAVFAGLGALAWFNPAGAAILAGLMLLGGVVFGVLASAVVALAAGTMKLINGVMSSLGVDAKSAAATADAVATLLSSTARIALAVSLVAPIYAALGAMAWWGITPATILAGLMIAGGVVFGILAGAVVALAAGTVKLVDAVMTNLGVDVNTAEATAKKVEAMSTTIKAVGGVMQTLTDAVVPFESAPWYTLWMGSSPADKLIKAMPKFARDFAKIAMFIRYAIIDPIWEYFPDSTKVEEAAKEVEGMGQIMKGLSVTLENITGAVTDFVTRPSFLGFTTGSSPAEKLWKAAPKFATEFAKVAMFIKYGVIDPIWEYFPDSTKVGEVAKEVEGMGIIMKGLNVTLSNITSAITDFVTAPSFLGFTTDSSPAEKLWEAVPKFAGDFAKVAMFIKYGVIDPIWEYFPDSTKVGEAAKEVEGMATIMTSLASMLKTLNDSIAPMIDGSGWFGNGPSMMDELVPKTAEFSVYFAAIAQFLKDGVIQPIKELPNAGELKQISETLSALTTVLVNLATTMDALGLAAERIGEADYKDISSLLNDLGGIQPNQRKKKGVFEQLFGPLSSPRLKNVNKKVVYTSKDTKAVTEQITDNLYKNGLTNIAERAKKAAAEARRIVHPNLAQAQKNGEQMMEQMFGTMENQSRQISQGTKGWALPKWMGIAPDPDEIMNRIEEAKARQAQEKAAKQAAEINSGNKLPGSVIPRTPENVNQIRKAYNLEIANAMKEGKTSLARDLELRKAKEVQALEQKANQLGVGYGDMENLKRAQSGAEPSDWAEVNRSLAGVGAHRAAKKAGSTLPLSTEFLKQQALYRGKGKIVSEAPAALEPTTTAAAPPANLSLESAWRQKADAITAQLRDKYEPSIKQAVQAGRMEEAARLQKLKNAANPMEHLDHINAIETEIGRAKANGDKAALEELYRRKWEPIIKSGEQALQGGAAKGMNVLVGERGPEILTVKPLGGAFTPKLPSPIGLSPSVAQLESTVTTSPSRASPSLSPMPMMTEDERAARFQQDVRASADSGDGKELASINQANQQQVNLLTMIHQGIMQLADLWRPNNVVQGGPQGQRASTAGHTPGRQSSDYAAWQVLQNNQASLGTNQTFNA